MIHRAVATKAKPTVEIQEANGRWTSNTLSAVMKTQEAAFRLGQEFEFQRFDETQVKVVFDFKGDGRLVERQYGDGLVTVTSAWKFSDSQLVLECTAAGVTAMAL